MATTIRSDVASTKRKARADVMADGTYQNDILHTCGKTTNANTAEDSLVDTIEDVVDNMKAEGDELALKNVMLVPSNI
ncbi:hypothetical protein ON010_g2261 [Phytophthora cinnamomi]|nr:hypothetical protein ON010_g2261 [Phytophthora cinnamomi]